MKNNNIRRILALLLAIIMTVSLFGCAAKQNETAAPEKEAEKPAASTTPAETTPSADSSNETLEPVKFATFLNMTGSSAMQGQYAKRFIDIYLEDFNANGGFKSLGGRPLEMVVGDIQSDITTCKTTAERVLSEGDITAVTSISGSAAVMAIMPVCEKYQVPNICGYARTCSEQGYKYHVQLTDGGRASEVQIDFLHHVSEQMGLPNPAKVGILYVDSEYGITTSDGNRKLCDSDPAFEVVYNESMPVELTDATSLVTALKAAGVEILFLTCEPTCGKAVYAAFDALDYHPFVMGGGSSMLLDTFGNDLGDDVIGICSTSALAMNTKNTINTPELQRYIDKYYELYGSYVPETALGAVTCMIVMIEAIENAGSTDKDVMMDYLLHNKFKTTFNCTQDGYIDFNDETGLNEGSQIVICQWQYDEKYGINIPLAVYPLEHTETAILYEY